MTVTITGDTILNLLKNPSGITTTHGEIVMDQAIDHLNIYLDKDNTISNLSGTAGSKTLSVSSRERGAINLVARMVYMSFLKQHGGSANMGSLGSSTIDLLSNPTSVAIIKEIVEAITMTEDEEKDLEASLA